MLGLCFIRPDSLSAVVISRGNEVIVRTGVVFPLLYLLRRDRSDTFHRSNEKIIKSYESLFPFSFSLPFFFLSFFSFTSPFGETWKLFRVMEEEKKRRLYENVLANCSLFEKDGCTESTPLDCSRVSIITSRYYLYKSGNNFNWANDYV